MFRYSLAIILLLPVLFFTSCCKKRVYCTSGNIGIAFTGFTRTESRSLILKRYAIGNEYKKAIDSSRLVYTGNAPVVLKKPDTLWLSDYSVSTGIIKDIIWGNEYVIEMPVNGRRFQIDAIANEGHNFEMAKCGDNGATCTNPIAAFAVNGGYIYGNKTYIGK
jgi:hypothetical protein